MSPTEAVMLTGYLRAHFPQQPVDEYTTEALSELLTPYAATDCHRAVLNIAERGEKWCSPTEVRAEVKRIRSRRIEAALMPDPPAGLSDAEECRWLGDIRRRIADGEEIVRAALPAPDPDHERRMRDLTRGAFHTPDEEAE